MTLSAEIRQLFKHQGPFATAYFDGSRNSEQGDHEVELRWQALRSSLESAGASPKILDTMDAAIGSDRSVAGRHGHLLVANEDGLLLDETTDEPPLTEYASWGALPHVMPFLSRRSDPVPHVVAVADRTGANVYSINGRSEPKLSADNAETLSGDEQHPVHKTGRDNWSERHFQNRVDNTWSENAADVAHSVNEQVRALNARFVLVAGDVRARNLVMHALAEELPPAVEVAETSAGGRADGASLEPVAEAAHDAVLRTRWRDRREILAKLQQGVGRGDLGITGLDRVLDALRTGQVETLVISDDPSSTERAWIGDEPLQLARTRAELEAFGVQESQEDRLDSALIRAVAGSAADLLITPNAHSYLADGIGATLRYSTPTTS
jgi:hypothetical protein